MQNWNSIAGQPTKMVHISEHINYGGGALFKSTVPVHQSTRLTGWWKCLWRCQRLLILVGQGQGAAISEKEYFQCQFPTFDTFSCVLCWTRDLVGWAGANQLIMDCSRNIAGQLDAPRLTRWNNLISYHITKIRPISINYRTLPDQQCYYVIHFERSTLSKKVIRNQRPKEKNVWFFTNFF